MAGNSGISVCGVILLGAVVGLFAVTRGLAQEVHGRDDSALLFGYFSLHHAIDRAAELDPGLRKEAAAMMGVSDADFALCPP